MCVCVSVKEKPKAAVTKQSALYSKEITTTHAGVYTKNNNTYQQTDFHKF